MSSICKKCGKEFSYGRQIYHKCSEGFFYFGSLFDESKKERAWNSSSSIKIDFIKGLTFEQFVEKIKDIDQEKIVALWNNLVS